MLVEKTCKQCGDSFTWNEFDGRYPNKEYCSDACRQKKYRQSERGMSYIKKYNQRYKRPDIEKTCAVCGGTFKTARKNRYICDNMECVSKKSLFAKKRRLDVVCVTSTGIQERLEYKLLRKLRETAKNKEYYEED